MKQWQVLRTVFPEVITDNFEFTDYVAQADRLVLNKPTAWNIGLMNASTCPAKIIKRALSVRMVLPTIRPYRISRFVVAVSIFMFAAVNG